jgi:hypothetical protein
MMNHGPVIELIVKERIGERMREAEQSRLFPSSAPRRSEASWWMGLVGLITDLFATSPRLFRERVECTIDPLAVGC